MNERRRRLTNPISKEALEAAASRVVARTPPRAATRRETRRTTTINTITNTTPTAATTATVHAAPELLFSAAAPNETREPERETSVVVLPARAQDIQTACAAFFTNQAPTSAPTVRTVHQWINGHMLGRNLAACSDAELEVVLEALEGRNAIMIDADEVTRERHVYLTH